MTEVEALAPVTAQALGLPPAELRSRWERMSFAALGGSSLQAVRLVGEAARLGTDLPLHRLLGREPVATVLRETAPLPPAPPTTPAAGPPGVRAALPGQRGMLSVEEFAGGSAYHLLFTAETDGASASAVAAALTSLVERHEGLRTVFVPADPDTGEIGRRVLPHARPGIRYQTLRPAAGSDAVASVHTQLSGASTRILRPYERPPVDFTITTVARAGESDGLLVSVLAHHALLDAWSVGVLFDELATLLAGTPLAGRAPSPETVAAEHRARTLTPAWQDRLRARADQLRTVPSVLELPTDVPRPARWDVAGDRLAAALGPEAARELRRLAKTTATTSTTVLLAAYALALARRCGVTELLIGVPVAGRRDIAARGVVAPCSQLVPVHCVVDDTATVTDYLVATSRALSEAVAASDLPVEDLVPALGAPHDRRRSPLVQFVLGAHDELIPERVHSGDVTLRLHEGHCHGAPFDATLYVQRLADAPRLALEYAHGAFTPEEAADFLDTIDRTLVELAERPGRPLATVRSVSPAQRARLDGFREGPRVPPEVADGDLWTLVLATARAHPDATAVRDHAAELTYSDLVGAVGAQAAALTGAGIGDGDPVLLAVERGVSEIVSVLAVLAIGAHYVAIDHSTPDERLRTLLDVLPPAAILASADPASSAFAGRAESACTRPARRVATLDVLGAVPAEDPAGPRPPRGDRVAYVAFTSGSTGLPKAVRVPHRAVVRLARPGPGQVVSCGPGHRMLRLAPLAFDASTLEVFAPLLGGGCVEVYPPGVVAPTDLARFLLERGVDVFWLTAGLFRLLADFAPYGFAGATHVLAGGDVVAGEQVRALLGRYPGLRVTNGYGPTENTTFSTVCHFDDPCDVTEPLPIGTPVPGSGALILDAAGRLVPPGGIGELHVTGLGLALDYAGDPVRTAKAFQTVPAAGERTYRTGDLVRLDGRGQLRFLGRTDRQVKIRGFRVEPDEIRQALVRQPGVKDAAVVVVGADAVERRLAAGIVPDGPAVPGLPEVAARLARTLPGPFVPALWAILDAIPLTTNGKVDTAAVAARARPLDSADSAQPRQTAPTPGAGHTPGPDRAAELTRAAWTQALGHAPSGPDADFFRAGGDSLSFARMLAWLAREYGIRIAARDLYSSPTPRTLARLIRPEPAATGGRPS